jgi:TPR repeat protein
MKRLIRSCNANAAIIPFRNSKIANSITIPLFKSLTLFALIFASSLFASDPRLKDYPKAQKLEQRAEKGDGYAMSQLASFYERELKDREKALYWVTKDCIKMDKECALEVGNFYYHRVGDYVSSQTWFEKAYKLGSAEGAFMLALSIEMQNGEYDEIVQEDCAEVIKYLGIADKRGFKSAAFELGRAYSQCESDCNKSYEFYEKSYKQGNKQAIYQLAQSECGTKEENYQNSLKWYMNGYKDKVDDSAHFIANTYEELKDYPNAIKWYETHYKERKSYGAAYDLAELYKNGIKDYPKAIEWYAKAYNSGSPFAAYDLGVLYEETLKDYPNAIKWYRIAIDKSKSTLAQRALDRLNKELQERGATNDNINASK